MARPCSRDLRERVISAVTHGGLSCHQAAAQFAVGVSSAVRWVQRFRTTGSAEPGQMGGYKPKAICGEHRGWLIERCHSGAFTLRGLVSELAERGLNVDYRAVWSFVHDEGLSYKKTSSVRRPACGGRNGSRYHDLEGSGRKSFWWICPRQKTWSMSRSGLADGDAFERSRLGN